MKAKKGFNLREICGEYVIVAEGKENLDFSNIIQMNETAAFLWKEIQGKDFTAQDLAQLLTDNYQIDESTPLPEEQALHDAQAVMDQWLETGIIEP